MFVDGSGFIFYVIITWLSSWQGKTDNTEHLSVAQSVSLGGAAVAIILPSPDQTQPDTEDRGLEKFIAPSFILFFKNLFLFSPY